MTMKSTVNEIPKRRLQWENPISTAPATDTYSDLQYINVSIWHMVMVIS